MRTKYLTMTAAAILLSSCGTDTRGWPKLEFPFGSSEVKEIKYSFDVAYKLTRDQQDPRTTKEGITNSKDTITRIFSYTAAYSVKPKKADDIETNKYYVKCILEFVLEETSLIYSFYGYNPEYGKILLPTGEILQAIQDFSLYCEILLSER